METSMVQDLFSSKDMDALQPQDLETNKMFNEEFDECVGVGSSDQVSQIDSGQNIEDGVLGQVNWRFQSRDELISTLKEYFSIQGYAISIKRSRKEKYVNIGCDRGGSYRNNWHIPMELRKKNTASRLINCPFDIRSKRLVDGTWEVEVKNGSHNHGPSRDMSAHPSCRRLSKDEIMYIEEMTRSGIPPRQILSSLRQRNPNLQAVSRTIYNMKAKLHKDNLAGRNMIQALVEELRKGDFDFKVLHDCDGHLTHLFFAHPSSIMLTKSYSNTFVMDCTYKTNKYKMPLLDIVGVSSFNTSFYSCFAFLEKEEKEDYIWALEKFKEMLGPDCHPFVIVSDRELALMNAIGVVFPTTKNLLCKWHIGKNILANCKSLFGTQDDWDGFLFKWNQVVESQDEVSYGETWKHFEHTYKGKEKILAYIRNTWLPYKEKFVRAWTDKYPYFGNRVSSRAEDAHAKLKKYLQVSTGDLRQVKNSICLAIENEFGEIKTQLASEKIRILHKCNIPFFKELVTNVSLFAMGELLKQFEMVKNGTMQSRCTGNFNKSMGLPCAHMMMDQIGTPLPLNTIHSQWRIDTRSFTSLTREQVNNGDGFRTLLCDLEAQYEEWPPSQREHVQGAINHLVNPSHTSLFEPK